MNLAYSTWGMQTVPIDVSVPHCAALGFDGLEMAVIPGWTTDAATMTAAERRHIRALYDDHDLALSGLSGNVQFMAPDPERPRQAKWPNSAPISISPANSSFPASR